MDSDPILQEVYRMKDELKRETGGDVEKLFEILRQAEKEHPERMVNMEQVRELTGRNPTPRKTAEG